MSAICCISFISLLIKTAGSSTEPSPGPWGSGPLSHAGWVQCTRKASFRQYLSMTEEMKSSLLAERAEETAERVDGLLEMLHGASLAARRIISMMDLER